MRLGKLLLCIALAFCLAFLGGALGLTIRERYLYGEESRRIWTVLCALKDRRPAHVNKRIWHCGVGWTVTAQVNVCSAPSMTSLEAMRAFGEKLDRRLDGEIDVDIFEWIWDRLAETGALGKEYTDRFRSSMHADMQPDSKAHWEVP